MKQNMHKTYVESAHVVIVVSGQLDISDTLQVLAVPAYRFVSFEFWLCKLNDNKLYVLIILMYNGNFIWLWHGVFMMWRLALCSALRTDGHTLGLLSTHYWICCVLPQCHFTSTHNLLEYS
jgi:hypothetical protein